ncbi:MAG: peptidase [Blastopirellula sp.]|nr:MAG: peptidase [Blastopirellula sp.]
MNRSLFSGNLLSVLGAFCLMAIVPIVANAAQPTFSSITPWGFQRGTEVEVLIRGSRLADANDLLFYEPGVEIKKTEVVSASQVKMTLAIAKDCKLGQHAIRIRTASGVSDMRLFYVGALPEVKEVEPNNDFEAPQEMQMNTTMNGVVLTEDQDYYVVTAKKGERITAELEGLRLGRTFFDPYLAILNEERFELSKSDDAPLLYQDCLCSIIAPKDGKYIIQVRESSFGGNGNCIYRLHVGNFPRPQAILPGGGQPGEEIEITWLGDAGGLKKQKIKLPETLGEFEYFAEDEHGIAPSPNRLLVTAIPNAVEVEPNNGRTEATAMVAPGAANGVLQEKGDEDWFKFTAKKGQRLDIRIHARKPLRSPADPILNVYSSTGGSVGGNDDSGGLDSYYRFTAAADGEYFIRIREHLKSGGETFIYRVELKPTAAALTMGIPEIQRYVARTLSIPQDNHMAILISARRESLSGAIDTIAKNLPEGIEMETMTMAANQTTVPLVFRAKADAPLSGTLVELVGKPVDSKYDVAGNLDQRTMIIRGGNNREMWGHSSKRMVTAVTEKVPFKIEIVQPKVPLVRNGSMQLKVIAHREEGFDADITLRFLYNPSGVSSSRSIKIAKGKTEALIPVTANSGAAIGEWKICIVGSAPHKSGSVEVSTPFSILNVSDRYFDLAVGKTAMELDQESQLVVKITKKKDFEGKATMTLLGLPAGATSEPVEITKDSTEAIFTIKATAKARVGRHKSILTRTVLTENGELVTHTLGTGEVRIDKPLPPKVATTAKPAAPKAKPVAKPPTKKILSRLEQLRLEKTQSQE